MTLNLQAHLGSVERVVSSVKRGGQPAHAVMLKRSYAVTVPDLWDAVTNPKRIPRWFLPVTGELEPGGRYQLEGNAGGVIIACEPPSRLWLTWEFGGEVSWVEVRTEEDKDPLARLVVTHTALHSEHWEKYGAGATGIGWEMALLGLAAYLAQPEGPQLDESSFASADGSAFIAGSSEAWGRAAVLGGADPGAARAAASRTTAFYTGEPVRTG